MNCSLRVERDDFGQWRRIFLTIVSMDKLWQPIPPRTKKNHSRIIPGMRHPILLPSKAYKDWEKGCIRSLTPVLYEMRQQGLLGLTDFVNCEAKIYRDRNVGDTNGYTQAIGDMLEKVGIIANDRQIESWDGTERLKDAALPRLELVITFLRPAKAKPSTPKQKAVPALSGLPLWDGSAR